LFSHSVSVLFRCLVIVFIILFSRFRDLVLLVADQKKKIIASRLVILMSGISVFRFADIAIP